MRRLRLVRELLRDAVVTQQTQIISYRDYRKLLLIMTQLVIPLPVVFNQASGAGAASHVKGAES